MDIAQDGNDFTYLGNFNRLIEFLQNVAYLGIYLICHHVMDIDIRRPEGGWSVTDMQELREFLLGWKDKLGKPFCLLCEDLEAAIELKSIVKTEEELTRCN